MNTDFKRDFAKRIEPGKIFEVYQDRNSLYTKNLTPGKTFFTERTIQQDATEYREWDPRRSKLAAAILKGCTNTFIRKGDEAIIPIPTFHRYEFHAKLMGGIPVFVPSHDFIVRAQDVLGKANKRSKIIFLCDPNNPTGIGIKAEEKEEIIRKFNGIVVIDEALADTTSIDNSQLIGKYNNVIVVRSFSKAFGLAALRIGYIIAGKEIIVMVAKTSSPFKVNGIAQELAIEALADSSYVKDSAAFIDKNSYFLRTSLNKLGIACTDSITTNFLADISSVCKSSKEFVQKLMDRDVLVTDADVFRVPKNTFIRVAVSNEDNNAYFLKSVKELLDGKVEE